MEPRSEVVSKSLEGVSKSLKGAATGFRYVVFSVRSLNDRALEVVGAVARCTVECARGGQAHRLWRLSASQSSSTPRRSTADKRCACNGLSSVCFGSDGRQPLRILFGCAGGGWQNLACPRPNKHSARRKPRVISRFCTSVHRTHPVSVHLFLFFRFPRAKWSRATLVTWRCVRESGSRARGTSPTPVALPLPRGPSSQGYVRLGTALIVFR